MRIPGNGLDAVGLSKNRSWIDSTLPKIHPTDPRTHTGFASVFFLWAILSLSVADSFYYDFSSLQRGSFGFVRFYGLKFVEQGIIMRFVWLEAPVDVENKCAGRLSVSFELFSRKRIDGFAWVRYWNLNGSTPFYDKWSRKGNFLQIKFLFDINIFSSIFICVKTYF